MKDRKFVIHIGLQKTASTFLQTNIFPNLKNVTYIGRPYTQENRAFNMLQYADDSLYDSKILQHELNEIDEKAPKGHTILISDELFAGSALYNFMNRGIIASRLQKVLPHAEMILFIRNQQDIILSLYKQLIKVGFFSHDLDHSFLYKPGKGLSLKDWQNAKEIVWQDKNRYFRQESLINVACFRYSKIYELYANLFEKVHVLLYEDFAKKQDTSLEEIATILSSEYNIKNSTSLQPIVNKSTSKKDLAKKILKNKFVEIANITNYYPQKLVLKIHRKLLSLSFKYDEKKSIFFINKLLKEQEIDNDNIILNKKLNLGMEKYADKYFKTDKL